MFSTSGVDAQLQTLRRRVRDTELRLQDLKQQLSQAEASARSAHELRVGQNLEPEWQAEVMAALGHGAQYSLYSSASNHPARASPPRQRFALGSEEYKRYGRQLIMPEIGLRGQQRLRDCAVLVVGVGGLGCPAAAYLAGAGVGTLGLVDGDTVEVSNLHRQIAHSTERVGVSKVDSAIEYLTGLNPTTNFIPHRAHLTPQDALSIFRDYDLVLDCTDHPTSRYLISDACVLSGKPLVSASALRTEGQLMVLNNPPRAPGNILGGPCYRCVFPKPPPAESVTSCSEGGILGPVVGLMGVLQALEAIKLIAAGLDLSESESSDADTPMSGSSGASTSTPPSAPSGAPSASLLLFSAYNTPQFRSIRLRSRRIGCQCCSATANISPESLTGGSMDYVAFCGAASPVNILPAEARISARQLASALDSSPSRASGGSGNVAAKQAQGRKTVTVLDVRDATQFGLCSLPGSINIPWTPSSSASFVETVKEREQELFGHCGDVVVVCKLGNDSQLAVQAIKNIGTGAGQNIKDVKGGLRAWREEVDGNWPDY
ncbi:hypothetical protein MBLNU459_g7812t1 [Dothideomycetes sp. NU459]